MRIRVFLLILLAVFVLPEFAAAAEPVSDTSTEIQLLTFHAHPGTGFRPLLRDLMQSFERPGEGEAVRWLILAASVETADEIRTALKLHGFSGPDLRTRFLVSPEAFNTWARDLYFFLRTGASGSYEIMRLSPHANPAEEKIASLISKSLGISARPIDQPFPFAGGDLTSDDAFVYLGEKSVRRMMLGENRPSREQVLARLEAVFQKELIILPGEDPHQDRYHMPLGMVGGERTSLLADPVSALRMLLSLSVGEKEKAILHYIRRYDWQSGARVRRDLEALFSLDEAGIRRYENSAYTRSLEKVEEILRARGIRVVRLPTLDRKLIPEEPLPLGLYYVNLVQDTYRDVNGARIRRKLVLPKYGIEPIDDYVRDQLIKLGGFEIRMIEAAREGYRGGGIRCLLQAAGAKITPTQPKELES